MEEDNITLTPSAWLLTKLYLCWAGACLRFMGLNRREHGKEITEQIFYAEREFDLAEGGTISGADLKRFDDAVNDHDYTWVQRIMDARMSRRRGPNRSQEPRLQTIDAYLRLNGFEFEPESAQRMLETDRRAAE